MQIDAESRYDQIARLPLVTNDKKHQYNVLALLIIILSHITTLTIGD